MNLRGVMRWLCFLALALPSFAAGTMATPTCSQLGNSGVYLVTWSWTGDASTGSVPAGPANCLTPAAAVGINLQGYRLLYVEVVPGTPHPTANYTVTVTDANGADELNGAASANLSATATQVFAAANNVPLSGVLTLNVSGNSVASAQGIVYGQLVPPSMARSGGGSSSGGGAPTGAAGGALAGTYPNPTLLTTPVYPAANNTLSGTNTITGTIVASGATRTAPFIVVASVGLLPATCTPGDLAFVSGAAAGQQIYECSSTNTWTQQSATAGVSSVAGGFGLTGGPIVSTGTLANDTTVMVDHAMAQSDSDRACAGSGSATAQSCTPSTGTWASYSSTAGIPNGAIIDFYPSVNTSGGLQINVAGLGNASAKQSDCLANTGTLPAAQQAPFWWNSTSGVWCQINPASSSSGGGGNTGSTLNSSTSLTLTCTANESNTFEVALIANVANFNFSGCTQWYPVRVIWVQSTGGFTVSNPNAAIHGFKAPGLTANTYSSQTWMFDGSNYIDPNGVVNQ